MNKFPTTILTVAGRPVLLKRAYSGNASAYECSERRIGAAVSYTPGRRLARFPDIADVLAALESLDGSALPSMDKPTTLRRVVVTLAQLPTGGRWNQDLLKAEIARNAKSLGYLIESLELAEGSEAGVLAYCGASLDIMATVELCRVVGKCKPVSGGVQ